GRRSLPRVTVAGLVLVRQRPGSAKGVVFMTIEDESGVANAIVWPKVFEAQRAQVIGARFVAITGRLQNEAGVIHVVAEHVEDLSPMLGLLATQGPQVSSLARADEVKRPQERDPREKQAARHAHAVLPRGRNFHCGVIPSPRAWGEMVARSAGCGAAHSRERSAPPPPSWSAKADHPRKPHAQ
ncbi:MAG: hypothetical protein K2Y29_21130, partial [Beijerinckiaceae bacterium]|nr:hypothetical protein [Beijerinckiaceae bacterium]